MSKTRLAVYGTLKAGFGNHVLLDNSEYVGKAVVTGTMHSMGGFPAICLAGDNQIHCEVYDVNDDVLERCDRLEGHPRWYERKVVNSSIGDVWIYSMDASELQDLPVVKSGNWGS